MSHDVLLVNGQPQGSGNPVNDLRHDLYLLCGGWKPAKAGRTAAIAAAKSDANGAGISPPGVAFSLRQIISSHINFTITCNVNVIILKYSGMIASRPVQVDFRLPAFSFRLVPDSFSGGCRHILNFINCYFSFHPFTLPSLTCFNVDFSLFGIGTPAFAMFSVIDRHSLAR